MRHRTPCVRPVRCGCRPATPYAAPVAKQPTPHSPVKPPSTGTSSLSSGRARRSTWGQLLERELQRQELQPAPSRRHRPPPAAACSSGTRTSAVRRSRTSPCGARASTPSASSRRRRQVTPQHRPDRGHLRRRRALRSSRQRRGGRGGGDQEPGPDRRLLHRGGLQDAPEDRRLRDQGTLQPHPVGAEGRGWPGPRHLRPQGGRLPRRRLHQGERAHLGPAPHAGHQDPREIRQSFHPSAPRDVKELDFSSRSVFAAVGGHGGGRIDALRRGSGALVWQRRIDGDAETIDKVGGEVFVGGHFDKICTQPAKPGGGACDGQYLARRKGARSRPRTAPWGPGTPRPTAPTGWDARGGDPGTTSSSWEAPSPRSTSTRTGSGPLRGVPVVPLNQQEHH